MGPVAAAVIPAAVTAGGQIVGGLVGKHGSNKAARTQAQSDAAALQFAKDNEARRRQEYDQQQAAAKAQWDAEQARLAPYRAASAALLSKEGDRLGLNLGMMRPPNPGGAPGAYAPAGLPPSGVVSGGPAGVFPAIDEESGVAAPRLRAPLITLADIANGTWNRRY